MNTHIARITAALDRRNADQLRDAVHRCISDAPPSADGLTPGDIHMVHQVFVQLLDDPRFVTMDGACRTISILAEHWHLFSDEQATDIFERAITAYRHTDSMAGYVLAQVVGMECTRRGVIRPLVEFLRLNRHGLEEVEGIFDGLRYHADPMNAEHLVLSLACYTDEERDLRNRLLAQARTRGFLE